MTSREAQRAIRIGQLRKEARKLGLDPDRIRTQWEETDETFESYEDLLRREVEKALSAAFGVKDQESS